jgi:bile acid-coenzyme A ligase
VAATLISGEEWLRHPGSVGKPTVGEIRILDENHDEVPTGEIGEIWMRPSKGTSTPYHYLGGEAESLPDGWESQGDLARVDDEGYIYLADRKPDMILVGGSNVYPAEIEAALEEHPAVLGTCVIGLPDEDYGSRVHAVVQCSDTGSDTGSDSVTEDELLEFLRERLVSYKLPRSVEFVDHPLRDEAGKVRRAQIRAERLPVARP